MPGKVDYIDLALGTGHQIQLKCLICRGDIVQTTDQVWSGLPHIKLTKDTSIPNYLCLVFGTCSICDVRVQSPLMLDSSLEEYYSSGRYRELVAVKRTIEDRTEIAIWRYDLIFNLIDVFNPEILTHMDFGGDIAELGRRLAETREFSSINIELNTEARSYAEAVNKISSYAEMLDEKVKFGVITALEVVEHVPDPVQLVSDLYNRLEDGGLLLLSVPFITKLFPQHFSLAHIHVFNESSINMLLVKAGVSEPHIVDHKNGAAFISVTRRISNEK